MITRRQFHFSCATGLGLLTAGAALAATGAAGWGLFWVGGIITTLAVSARVQALRETTAARIPARIALRPVTPWLDH